MRFLFDEQSVRFSDVPSDNYHDHWVMSKFRALFRVLFRVLFEFSFEFSFKFSFDLSFDLSFQLWTTVQQRSRTISERATLIDFRTIRLTNGLAIQELVSWPTMSLNGCSRLNALDGGRMSIKRGNQRDHCAIDRVHFGKAPFELWKRAAIHLSGWLVALWTRFCIKHFEWRIWVAILSEWLAHCNRRRAHWSTLMAFVGGESYSINCKTMMLDTERRTAWAPHPPSAGSSYTGAPFTRHPPPFNH